MPLPPEPGPVAQAVGILVLCAMAAAALLALTKLVLACWPLVPLLLTMFVCSWIHGHPTPTDRTPRANATICHFARAFERRAVDTWILRATYEHLSQSHGKPIRADDRLDLLDIDPEEIDFEIAGIADHCGRSLDHPEANPFFERISTVRDLVRFLNHQPMLAATRALRGLPA